MATFLDPDPDLSNLAASLNAATKAGDWGTARTLLEAGAPSSFHDGSGSTIFQAVSKQCPSDLFEIYLSSPGVEEVLNGTSMSWAPLSTALVAGNTTLARMILDHDAFVPLADIPWQLENFVIRESVMFAGDPSISASDYAEILEVVQLLFERCPEFGESFDEFRAKLRGDMEQLVNSVPASGLTLPQFMQLVSRCVGEMDGSLVDEALEDCLAMFTNMFAQSSVVGINGDQVWTQGSVLKLLREDFIGGDGELDLQVVIGFVNELPATTG